MGRAEASPSKTTFDEKAVVRALRAAAEPLPDLDDAAFAARFDRYADARVVLIGEGSHGTSEFYRARATITRRLIERHGFRIVAVEADWPDALQVDRHVRGRPRTEDPEPAFARFPTWMWRNRETADFIGWLARWNATRAADDRAEFRGLDVYSLRNSIAEVLRYLEDADPEAARSARQRYGCLTPWQADPALYGRQAHAGRADCEDAVVAQLREMLSRRIAGAQGGDEELFDAAQNARVVRSAEQYYRAMFRSSAESWNLRDRHMFETLDALLERRGADARAVVWAHNSHIGNAAATSMGWSGEFNIGELCRKVYGRDAVAIGQGTDRGTVAAADDWDEPMQVMTVRPCRDDSWEHLFLQTGEAAPLTDWRAADRAALRETLGATRLERAIGVVYRPRTERYSHYFDAVLAEQFDAWLWFRETHAVTPLATGVPRGAPDTYPFGL